MKLALTPRQPNFGGDGGLNAAYETVRRWVLKFGPAIGATPWQTLVAATRHGAAVCGVGAELGTVEAGKLADLIVVAANPLEDINNVRRLQLVLKEGRVISDKRHPSGVVAQPHEVPA